MQTPHISLVTLRENGPSQIALGSFATCGSGSVKAEEVLKLRYVRKKTLNENRILFTVNGYSFLSHYVCRYKSGLSAACASDLAMYALVKAAVCDKYTGGILNGNLPL